MISHFHQRFNIQVDIREARKRFINRIHTMIYQNLPEFGDYDEIKQLALFRLGKRHDYDRPLADFLRDDFHEHLEALEAIYFAVPEEHNKEKLLEVILWALALSEIDLGVRWKEDHFLPSGAELLDDKLVNEPLRWLSDAKYKSVLDPFQKGLDHFLRSQRNPKLRADVVTDMYEAVEALAKIVTEKDKDLSANRELFIEKVKASEDYKKILKEYINFACKFRHAPSDGKPKPNLTEGATESFIYSTGLFIRLAMN